MPYTDHPKAFIVGAPKCGTTALCHYLDENELIYFPIHTLHMQGKFEPHYFSPVTQVASTEEYADLYKPADDNQISFDASVYYLYYADESATKIYKHNPAAKIIIMLRNPWEVLESHYLECIYQRSDRSVSLEQALNEPRVGSITDHSNIILYSRGIEQFMNVFGGHNVKLLFFDDFKKNPQKTTEDVCNFIGVPPHTPANTSKINTRKHFRWHALRRFLASPPNWASTTSRLLPKGLSKKVIGCLRSINTSTQKSTSRKHIVLSPKIIEQLERSIAADIARIETITGRNLNAWKHCPDTFRADF